MSTITDKKITDGQRNAVWVQHQQDRLTGTPQQNKAVFDEYSELIREHFNEAMDAIDGRIATNDSDIEQLKETDAGAAATAARESAESASESAQATQDMLGRVISISNKIYTKAWNVTEEQDEFVFTADGYTYNESDTYEVFVNGLKLSESEYTRNEDSVVLGSSISAGNTVEIIVTTNLKGKGIADTELNDDYTLTINYDDGTSDTTESIRGEKGEKGDKGDGVYDDTEVKTDIAVLESRVDSFTHLTEGSTTGDAELIDARIGYDGKTYSTAGDAVRGQTSNIKPMQLNKNKVYYPTINIDGITTGTGYYTWNGVGATPLYRTALQHLIVPVVGGDVIQCYVGNQTIGTSEASSYFTTVDSNGKGTAFTSDWQLINQDEHIYQFTVPANATTLYLTYASGITPWAKKCVGTFEIDWLKLKEENFDDGIIPESAINKSDRYKYTDSLMKPFTFNGKTVAYFGDSIPAGVCSPNSQTTVSFMQRFCLSVGFSVINPNAISGACIADPNYQGSVLNKVLAYENNRDFYFVAGGTNDFNTSKELGTYASTDTSTFYGALKAICDKFQTDFPNATVIFITPIPYTEAYFDRYPALKDGNALGYTLNDYRNAIYEVATSYGFNVVDGSNLGMPTGKGGWSNAMCDDSDGCHPTVAGHELYARNLHGKLC